MAFIVTISRKILFHVCLVFFIKSCLEAVHSCCSMTRRDVSLRCSQCGIHLTFTTCSTPSTPLPQRLTVKQQESGLGILLVQHVLRAKVLMTSSFKNFHMHALQGHRLVPLRFDSQLCTAGIHHKCNHQVMPPSSFNLIFLNCQ